MSDRSIEHPYYNPDRFPHFEPPRPSPRFWEVAYGVSGHTRAQNELITFAQDELLSCLLMDMRVTSRLQQWTMSVGLPEIENDIADFLNRVVPRLGLSSRADLVRPPPIPRMLVEDLLPEWYKLQDRLYTTYERGPEILKIALTYVRNELQQRPWLAYRLTENVFEEAWTRATGIRRRYSRPSYMDDSVWGPLVQPFRHVLETRDGETLDEAKRRLMAEAENFCANLQASEDLPKGLLQKNHEWKTRRNTRWLYRHLICGERMYQIAKAYHEEHQLSREHRRFSSCKCDDLVSKGITNAQELLSLPLITSKHA